MHAVQVSWPTGGIRMAQKNFTDPDPEFACPRCDSPSVAYPEEGDRVVCAGCGAFLATRTQFRRFIEPREKRSEIQTSGC
jgi:ribosomal protein S27E